MRQYQFTCFGTKSSLSFDLFAHNVMEYYYIKTKGTDYKELILKLLSERVRNEIDLNNADHKIIFEEIMTFKDSRLADSNAVT